MKKALLLLLVATPAAAQPNTPPVSDIEVPSLVIDTGETTTAASDEALDLANIVQSAAKGVTTVQEAPAIVTVVTSDEIRDRQYHDLFDIVKDVPGWGSVGIYHSNFPTPLVRGQVQAVQFLHDGVSLFDPFVNVPGVYRAQPMELIKRVEMITGPGGVLWGSNSLLGIMNVITKDAEDVEGIEVGTTLGDGPGDARVARAYVMAGKSDMMGGKLKLFGHASVETYQGPALAMPLLLFHDPLPQPNSENHYGPLLTSNEAQSYLVTIDGKLTYDKLQIRVFAPFGQMYKPMGFSGEPVRDTCSTVTTSPHFDPNDPKCAAATNRSDTFDRYAVAEYRTRFAGDKAGITLRGYAQQFVRGFQPLQVISPQPSIPGGLSFDTDLTSYRAGAGLDGDIEAAQPLRILYGAEAFREWENGPTSTFRAPYDPTLLPILCPRIYDAAQMKIVPVPGCAIPFAYAGDRTVLGAYIDPQLRIGKTLILDAGARLQIAPDALGSLGYPLGTTYGGAVVWNFIPNWHLKLNYTQGFRPPVFNNTESNGEGVQIAGNPKLNIETSDAAQAEINARIFKGDRRIRELSFRIDGSYTRLSDLIQVTAGSYTNSGKRGIASAEFLGKLYVQGGHRIELGYTWLRVDTSDRGRDRALPEHWFNLATVFSLISDKLSATTNLRVTGAAEDPNRLVEYRNAQCGTVPSCSGAMPPVTVAATDLVLDRIPPMAELSAGIQWMPTPKIAVRATVYDALFGHYYQPDVFFDYEPHLEYLPNPFEGFRAYLSALIQY
jgi:outer membrane receptor protein involved in Fe transport